MTSALSSLRPTAWYPRLRIAVEPVRFPCGLAVGGFARVFRPDAGGSLRSFHGTKYSRAIG